jgi:hypothetical protein
MVDFTPRAVVVAAREWVREGRTRDAGDAGIKRGEQCGREVNRVDRRVRATVAFVLDEC